MEHWDAEQVEARLIDAGRTLMAMQVPGTAPAGFRSAMPEIVRDVDESYGWDGSLTRPGPPGARAIARMDQALSWIPLIPADKPGYRRVVGARMLVHPETDRHVFGWVRIGARLGIAHETARRWHAIALTIIAGRLNATGLCASAGGAAGPGRQEIERAMRRVVARSRRELV